MFIQICQCPRHRQSKVRPKRVHKDRPPHIHRTKDIGAYIFIPAKHDTFHHRHHQQLQRCHLAQHSKYANNYDYHKAVWLLNRESLVENGFLLVKEDEGLFSPIGTLFVERHDSCAMAIERLAQRESEIQVAVVRESSPWSAVAAEAGLRCVSPGAGQRPSLMDFADGVDTLDFLLGL